MNESILKALLRLFALVSEANRSSDIEDKREIIRDYLNQQFDSELAEEYLNYFDYRVRYYHPESLDPAHDVIHGRTLEERLIDLCNQLNEELQKEQKILVIINLLDFISIDREVTRFEINFVDNTAGKLKIDEGEYKDLKEYTFGHIDRIRNRRNLLIISSEEEPDPGEKDIKHMYIRRLDGKIIVLYLRSSNTFVLRYYGSDSLTFHSQAIKPYRSYIWSFGGVIKNSKFGSVYYTWVSGKFIQETTRTHFVFNANHIEYSYGNSPNGIKPFTLTEESGRLIGIIGGSGSGKSTLLNLLNGNLKPKRGNITINGFDIHEDSDKLKGVIGYVPQDDVLVKEFTVFQNLYYNAKLCFSDYSEEQIRDVVENSLVSFDLDDARDLRVGDALNTFLSGGQRKRLNIALELMREPSILFVDEPTSGLSSADSEKVMLMLKRQTFKGRLIFSNIHQPSSDIFKMLDKLLVIDQGGHIIYYGNPVDAITYFKRMNNFVDSEQSECPTCGNIQTEQILRNVESRVVDVDGKLTRKRKISPEEWYKKYMKNIDPIIQRIRRPYKSVIPHSDFKTPSRLKQLRIYFTRDLLTKIANKQYLLLVTLEAPILALLLAFITRNSNIAGGVTEYLFRENPNIPGFLFMSVIVALFLGLIISAEEIFKDKRLLEREKFLNLSRSSYLNAKISVLVIISAFHMMAYTLIGNHILEIKGMTWAYFFILFTTALWANMVGLNISSGFKSIVAIYILVPLILVPQLLFSGVVIDFRNMHQSVKSEKYVPVIGNLITSRWTYEALVVTQFKENKFEKHFYETEANISRTFFDQAYRIPIMESALSQISNDSLTPAAQSRIGLLKNEMSHLVNSYNIDYKPIREVDRQSLAKFKNQMRTLLDTLDGIASSRYSSYKDKKQTIQDSLLEELGGEKQFKALKDNYHNKRLATLATNSDQLESYYIEDEEIIYLRDPVYLLPDSRSGRAHYFAPAKFIGDWNINTFAFNIIRIWLAIFGWYVLLYFDVLNKIISYFESIRLQRLGRKRFFRLFGLQETESFRFFPSFRFRIIRKTR
ncbi:MAG: ATP-binding cassette domain-containing protein [Bacteroidales bacterium]